MTLERIEHKVFASEAPLEEMGQFGSALATTKLNTKDVAEIQALPAYTKGWGSAIISENNYPAMEEMNGVLNVMSYHTGYLYQEGIPTYSATQEYSATSWVKDLAGEKVYKSLQGGNKGHDLTDPAWWMELKLGGGGLEIGDIGFTQMAIDESKGKRRVLNGQLIIQDQYAQFANIIKNSVALNPDLACTESEWQTAVTMSTDGVCYKFVIDDEAGTIRLPKYPQCLMKDFSLASSTASVAIKGNGVQPRFAYSSATGTQYNAVTAGADLQGSRAIGIANSANTGDNVAVYFSNSTTYSGLTGTATLPKLNSEEVIKGQYFIQVATGAETEDNIINEIELNNPFSLLDYKHSEYELNNLSWLRSNGQYNSKAVYPAVYELLLKIYNGVETKAGVSVKLSTETFADTDFVLNTADETFRLPLKVKQKFFNSGNVAVVGNGKALGLTDGSTNFVMMSSTTGISNYVSNLCLSTNTSANAGASVSQSTNVTGKAIGVSKSSSNSGLVAQLSSLETTGLYLYFYVGETVQNANLINAGRIEERVASLVTITESYVNGTSWYRVWSDGFKEQGGTVSLSSYTTTKNTSVTLLKPFSNANYTSIVQMRDGGTYWANVSTNVNQSATTLTIVVYTDQANINVNAHKLNWYACGY